MSAAAAALTGASPPAVPASVQSAAAFASDAYAELAGRRIRYRDTGGAGTPIVLMHAGTGSSLVWERQVPAFGGAGFRVIAYDRLGYGKSTLDAGAEPGTAADDLQSLLRHLRIDRFHLVGTAAGGIVSLDYALSFPQQLRSLVIANSIGGVQDEEYLALGRRLRPSPQFDALPPEVRELGPSYRAADAAGTERWIDLERLSRAKNPLPSPQTSRNRITFALLETIRVPTLLLTGGADLYAPPPVLRLFSARIHDAETLVVPDAGHSTYWEQSDTFNHAVLTFIARH